VGERDQSAKEKRKNEQVHCSVARASQKGTVRGFKKRGDPPARGGPSTPVTEREQSAGNEKKKEKDEPGG
jgi:hypothetical protein